MRGGGSERLPGKCRADFQSVLFIPSHGLPSTRQRNLCPVSFSEKTWAMGAPRRSSVAKVREGSWWFLLAGLEDYMREVPCMHKYFLLCCCSGDSGPGKWCQDIKRIRQSSIWNNKKLKKKHCILKQSYATLNEFPSHYPKEFVANNNGA